LKDLVVASYNVHRCVGLDGRRDVDRIAAVLGEIGADVVGLQEIDADPLDALAEAAGYAAVAGPTLERHDGHTGNALLTRLPITTSLRLDLSVPGREPRGALDVELDAGPGVLRVVVTHFGLRAGERREQCERLLSLLAPRGEDAAVLLGDFNEWFARAALLRRIHRTFGRAHGVRSWPSFGPLLALDRLWVRPERALRDLRAHRSARARVASDHLPIRAMLAFAK
jgi:endonuclease/exonuclease/phosphatase family metal-dependent hydrolase